MLLVSIIAIVAISCKKEKTPQPATESVTIQMYCLTFIHMKTIGEPDSIPQIDTVYRMCGDKNQVDVYKGVSPNDYPQWLKDLGANYAYIPKEIADCSECQ